MNYGRLLLVVAVGFATAACGSSQKTGEAPASFQNIQYPDWVMKGSGAFGGEAGRVFYGVGAVSGIKNQGLARSTADNRARAEIAKVFETYSASLMKDYMAATSSGDQATEEQHVEQAIKTFSATTLSGVEIVDRWFHPEDGSVYSLARLDLEAFKDNLDKMNDLNAKVRDYVRENAERAHADLEAEEEKRSGGTN